MKEDYAISITLLRSARRRVRWNIQHEGRTGNQPPHQTVLLSLPRSDVESNN